MSFQRVLSHWRMLSVALLAFALFPLTNLKQASPDALPSHEEGSWRSLNNYALIFLESWRQFGPAGVHFGLKMPIDHTDYSVAGTYSSYPAGYLTPLYLWERFSPWEVSYDAMPTLARVKWLAQVNHLFLAVLLGWIALSISGEVITAFAAVVSGLFLPPFLLFQHNILWPDTVGLTMACLAYLAYVRTLQSPSEFGKDWFLGTMVMAGSLVDWFTPILSGTIVFGAGKRGRLVLVGAVLLALGLFLIQQYLLSGLSLALHKFQVRSGLIPSEGYPLYVLLWAWMDTLAKLLGPVALFLPPVALALASYFPEARARLGIFWPWAAAVFLHWLIFNQHYPGHQYNAIRWAALISLLPACFPRRGGALASVALIVYVASVYPLYGAAQKSSPDDLSALDLKACRLVERHHAPEKLFVSGEFHFSRAGMGHIWFLPWCKSTVLRAGDADDVAVALRDRALQSGYRSRPIEQVYFLTRAPGVPGWIQAPVEIDREEPWRLLKIDWPPGRR